MKCKPILLALVLVSCGSHLQEDPLVKNDSSPAANAGRQTNPKTYKLNSVLLRVKAGGVPVPGTTVTVVQTNETMPIQENGTLLIVLDPEILGTDTHELLFSAPGHADVRETITIRKNQKELLEVELVPAG